MARKSVKARYAAMIKEAESWQRCVECGASAYMADGVLRVIESYEETGFASKSAIMADIADDLNGVVEAVEAILTAMRTGKTSIT